MSKTRPGPDEQTEPAHSQLDIRPQQDNINRHTPRGLSALEEVIQQDGTIGAITIAADGEAFDGSARLEKAVELGLPLRVIDTDGTELIVTRRKDIPTAADPRARRLGIAANRVAQIDFDPDPVKLAAAHADGLLSKIQYSAVDVREILAQAASFMQKPQTPPPGSGGDDFDTGAKMPKRAMRGDIWKIGPHTLMCGDCRREADMRALLHERRASLMIADPPYNVGVDYEDDGEGGTVDDNMGIGDYHDFCEAWFPMWSAEAYRTLVTPGGQNLAMWDSWYTPFYIAPWIKLNALTHGRVSHFWVWEPVLYFGGPWPRRRANDVFNYSVTEQRFPTGESLTPMHPCPKPLALWTDFIESYTDYNDLIIDPMAGTGTTMVAAHRTGRIALSMESSPAYCDVQLSRALAEGIGPIERIAGHRPTEPVIEYEEDEING